jgi:ElaB/YqjD/DUF883 family membrane-anchored ribosome-binding protein
MKPIQEQIQANFTDLKNRLNAIVEETDINHKASVYTAKVKSTIQKYPIPSLVVGLAFGFLVGKLLSDSEEAESSKE